MLDVSVIVPARNAAGMIAECLTAILAEHPREVIVVDGQSTDETRAIAGRLGARVISDDGRGLPYARLLGARTAVSDTVALIDSDVLVPPGALRDLVAEFTDGDFAGLQAGIRGASLGGGYWSRALAFHQNIGLVRHMFGVSATLMRRDVLLDIGFDDRFSSGEDIDLRHRLEDAGHRIGVAERATVAHRFPDGWDFAKGQWLADGTGLGRMIRVHGADHGWLAAVPLAAALRGLLLGRTIRWLPYFLCFVLYNYRAMAGVLLRRTRADAPARAGAGLAGNGMYLAAARIAPMIIGFGFWIVAARLYPVGQVGLAAAVTSAALLCAQLAILGQGNATVSALGSRPGSIRGVLGGSVPVVVLGALIAAGAAVGLFLWLDGHLATALSEPSTAALFVGVCVASTTALYLDHVAVAIRRADQALRRSVVQAVTGFAMLLLAGDNAVTAVLLAWNAGMWLSVAIGARDAFRACVAADDTTAPGRLVLLREGLAHHGLTIADRAPGLLLPVLVTELASPAWGGYWYVAWMIALAAWYVPNSAAQALQAELAAGTAGVSHGVRTTLVAGAVVAGAGIVASWPALWLFGAEYPAAWPALVLLLASVIPQAVTQLALATDRARGRFRTPTAVLAAGGLVALAAGTAAVAVQGITALAAVWLVLQSAIAAGYGWRRIRPLLGTVTTAAVRPAPTPPATPAR